MEHGQVVQQILDHGWSRADLEQAAQLLSHVSACPQCDQQLNQFDTLRSQLAGDTQSQDVQPDGGWDAFFSRLDSTASKRNSSRWWWPGGATAIAASLLIVMIGGSILFWQARSRTPDAAPTDQALAALLPDATTDQVRAFETVSQMFEGRAGWVALSGQGSDMGLAAQPIAADQRLMVLRLTLAGASGDVAAQTDLMILPGQNAVLTIPAADGRIVTYQVSVSKLQPNRLAIWSALQRDGQREMPEAIAANLDLRANQVASAGGMLTDSGRYDLKVGFREVQWK